MAKNAPTRQVLERPNLRDHIHEILKKEIILRRIKPGEKINEEELAQSLQVSRTPVRETLLRLEHEGIVEIIPRRGAFVVSQSKQKVMDILQVREVLEGLVARLATENMDERILNRLRNSLKKISSTKNDEDMLLKYPAADAEFHSLLLDTCKNDVLKNMMEIVNSHLQVIRLRTVVLPGRAKQTVKEHYKILEAIEKRNALSAESMMRKHVESVRKDALENIDLME
ncbi:MAG: GntR family transcriptional regulator [Desulfobacteraceae bacterium]|jgi:DNA-binding GntR family transcriptional regulator